MTTRFLKLGALAVLLLACGTPAAHAQGLILPRMPRPTPSVRPLFVKAQKITMASNNGALKVQVEQTFVNPNSQPFEGTYLFPLPEGATVSSFSMTIDKEPVEGKLLTVEEARHVYESYVRRNIDPAILEYVGRNAFQARVFPIPANSEKKIYLTYSQAPEFVNGVYKIVYPLNSERLTNQTAGDVDIECTLRNSQPIKAVYSPTHEIQVRREGENLARVSFEGKDVRANKDFLLYYGTSEKAFGLNALSYRKTGEDGYAMLMLAPKREVRASEVQPKDVVVVFDTSGSMQGAKIDQARKALLTIVGALNDRDRFNVIRFSSDVTTFKPAVVDASAENRAEARKFVEDFKAVGGTNIDEALEAAFASMPKPEARTGRAPYLIFMTDGLPTVGNTDVNRILDDAKRSAPADLRLFSFGVGADVNTLLLDRLARDHRGAADYIAENEDLEAKIGSFYAKIAEPVLANVKLTVSGAELKDIYPSRLPDLFAGTQLLVLGRYKGQGKATVNLTGELNGKPQQYTYEVNFPERDTSSDFIPKLWAGRRIGFLLEEIRLHGENAELKNEVIRLSKEHGIVTPYTSYLVEEPGLVPPPVAFRGPAGPNVEGFRDRGVANRPAGAASAGGGGGFGGGGLGGGLGGSPAAGGFGRYAYGEKRALDAPAITPADAKPSSGASKAEADKKVAAKPAARAPAKDSLSKSGEKGAKERSRFSVQEPFYKREAQELKQKSDSSPQQLQQQQLARQQAAGFRNSTGWNSVEASRRVRELKDSTKDEAEVEVSRTVSGREFRPEKGSWVDSSITPKMARVTVKYGSDAYFKLISAHADWARWLSLGKTVQFRTGKSTIVVVGETGKDKLTDAELKALEK